MRSTERCETKSRTKIRRIVLPTGRNVPNPSLQLQQMRNSCLTLRMIYIAVISLSLCMLHRESQDRVIGREKITTRQCKDMLEKQIVLEQTLMSKYFGTGIKSSFVMFAFLSESTAMIVLLTSLSMRKVTLSSM